MRSSVSFVTVPTADTPGTLLSLTFDDRSYLIGNLAEGSSRACTEASLSLRKVSDVFLTGTTRWGNVGGLLGMVLGLADMKKDARAASLTIRRTKVDPQKVQDMLDIPLERLRLHGSRNLNHVIATARRFIFRTGMPIDAKEHITTENDPNSEDGGNIQPTYHDDRIKVWAMPIQPSNISRPSSSGPSSSPIRKRTFEEANSVSPRDQLPIEGLSNASLGNDHKSLCTSVVQAMFDSDWKLDRLVPRNLADVRMPGACFLKDALTGNFVTYDGPKPGGNRPVPNITVLVREPWPGSDLKHLPPTKPALESMSYIFSNHEQRGVFLPENALKLDIPKGKLWHRLTTGESVENRRGETITSDMVLTPSKPGIGFAVVELPNTDYIEPCVNRPEWLADNVVESLRAIVWILGPGVGADARLGEFQKRMSHLKHFVSSSDYAENYIALEGAATNALRHNHIDDELFPLLHSSSIHSPQVAMKENKLRSDLPLSRPTQVGQRLVLQTKLEIDDCFTKAPMDIQAVRQTIKQDFARSSDVSRALKEAGATPAELNTWLQAFPHGDVEILVLGTGSSHPSKHRNVSGTLIRIPEWGSILLDSGEGTMNTLQRMLSDQELKTILRELRLIWISHLHADHHLGLVSVINAWSASCCTNGSLLGAEEHDLTDTARKLTLLSGEPMCRWLHEYSSVENLDLSRIRTISTSPSNPLHFNEQSGQTTEFFEVSPTSDISKPYDCLKSLDLTMLNTVFVNHCHGAQAVSVTFPSGFKLSYSGDCRPSTPFTSIGRESDVLIHEATFEDDMWSEALAKKHSTVGEALIVASKMKAKVTLLTHFSQRYPMMPNLGMHISGSSQTAQTVQTTDPLSAMDGSDTTLPEADRGESGVRELETHDSVSTNSVRDLGSKSSSTSSRDGAVQGKRHGNPDSRITIDQGDVQRLVESGEMKVAFAFDYMRLKLKSIPILMKKQPVLKAMYDLGIGKQIVSPAEQDQDQDDKKAQENTRRGKKEATAAKVEKAKVDAREKKRLKAEQYESRTNSSTKLEV